MIARARIMQHRVVHGGVRVLESAEVSAGFEGKYGRAFRLCKESINS